MSDHDPTPIAASGDTAKICDHIARVFDQPCNAPTFGAEAIIATIERTLAQAWAGVDYPSIIWMTEDGAKAMNQLLEEEDPSS